MPVDETLPNYAFDFIKDICEQFGPRFSCSDAEKKANLWIKDQFAGYCDDVHVEEFSTYPELYPQGIIKVCGVIGGIAFAFMPLGFPFMLGAALAIFAALFVLFAELFLIKRWIRPFFKKGTSTNTWGRIKPKNPGPPKWRIVFEGHTDSAKEMRLMNGNKDPPMKIFAIGILYLLYTLVLSIVEFVIMLAQGNAAVLFQTPGGVIQWTLVDWIYFVPLIGLYPCFLYLIYGLTGNKIVDGANDNLSGVGISAALGKHFHENRPKHVEIIIGAMGSEENGDQGAKAFVAKHPELLGSAYAFVIDSAGSGKELFIVEHDGMHRVEYSPEVIERMHKAYDLHKQEYPNAIALSAGNISLGSSDACMYVKAGSKASFIIAHAGAGLKKPPHWHSMTDTWQNIDKQVLRDVIGMAIHFVNLVDQEQSNDL